ncbi:MAG: DUF222 domain-containing protein, partial [Nigerium sp.]|nr:DUF222 domain-containing protein [Nigerium sp.]
RIVDGHCDLWGRLDAADGVAFDQALDALAATLLDGTPADSSRLGEAVGVQLSRDHRRAVAVGVLARQALGQSELPRAAQIVVRIDATTGIDAVGVRSADSLVLSPVARVRAGARSSHPAQPARRLHSHRAARC